MASSKNVVFDVVGTLVGYEELYAAIEKQLGERLRQHDIKTDMFGYMWVRTTDQPSPPRSLRISPLTAFLHFQIEVAEREYTYNSMSGNYVGFEKTFTALFYRMLWKAGIPDPRSFASDDDLQAIVDGYNGLKFRPGAAECIQKLRDAGFAVWCFTMGGLERVGGYFKQAGVELEEGRLLSCDSSGVGKPDPEAYRPLLERLSGEGDGKPWFAAAHQWDASAARRTG